MKLKDSNPILPSHSPLLHTITLASRFHHSALPSAAYHHTLCPLFLLAIPLFPFNTTNVFSHAQTFCPASSAVLKTFATTSKKKTEQIYNC